MPTNWGCDGSPPALLSETHQSSCQLPAQTPVVMPYPSNPGQIKWNRIAPSFSAYQCPSYPNVPTFPAPQRVWPDLRVSSSRINAFEYQFSDLQCGCALSQFGKAQSQGILKNRGGGVVFSSFRGVFPRFSQSIFLVEIPWFPSRPMSWQSARSNIKPTSCCM